MFHSGSALLRSRRISSIKYYCREKRKRWRQQMRGRASPTAVLSPKQLQHSPTLVLP